VTEEDECLSRNLQGSRSNTDEIALGNHNLAVVRFSYQPHTESQRLSTTILMEVSTFGGASMEHIDRDLL
jgi:hypothetical protein